MLARLARARQADSERTYDVVRVVEGIDEGSSGLAKLGAKRADLLSNA